MSVPISSVDANNRFLLNGVPTFVISSSKADYTWFGSAGYSASQQTTKIQELVTNGVTASVDNNWLYYAGGVPPYTVDQEFTNFGWSAVGSFMSDLSIGQTAANGSDAATISAIVNRFKGHAGLIGWSYVGEINPPGTSVPDLQAGVANAKAADNSQRAIINIFAFLQGDPTPFVGPGLVDVPILELTIGEFPTSAQQLNHQLDALNTIQSLRTAGTLFCPGVSATPLKELIGSTGGYRLPTNAELQRWFWLAMAFNARWVDLLWAANQRAGAFVANLTQASKISVQSSDNTTPDARTVGINGLVGGVYTHEDLTLNGTTPVVSVNTYDNAGFGCATCWPTIALPNLPKTVTVKQVTGGATLGTLTVTAGDSGPACVSNPPSNYALGQLGEGMPVGFLTVYAQTLAILANLRSWAFVWTDPASFVKLTTSPVYADRSGFGSSGIYAASKTIGGTTYIIACNVDTGGDSVWTETAKLGATITVGSGTVCTPVFGTPAPTSFLAGVITADFAAMETKIFQVT